MPKYNSYFPITFSISSFSRALKITFPKNNIFLGLVRVNCFKKIKLKCRFKLLKGRVSQHTVVDFEC